ncbi:ribosomal protein L4 domain-containing protein [Lenzites betulinus]|nr:ribosomal protein L4 domain-containing protein [Lenzites betulinus]
MLAAFRRAAGQNVRSVHRGLSTSALASSERITEDLVGHRLQDALHSATLSVPAAGLSDSSAALRPVYLEVSSLIRPEENTVSSEELVELDPHVFSHPIRRDILHLCVVHHLDCQRQGSANTKTRGEVRGSGHKIRPQKGSGRARLGDAQSPMLRGGGVAFGPKPRDFATKLNRKVIEMGMRVALSARVKEQSLGVVRSLEWSSFKTKDLQQRIEELGWWRTLFVTGHDQIPEGLDRASSNLPMVDTVTAADLNVYTALRWPRLVLDLSAVEWFERALGKPQTLPRDYKL